MYTKLFSSITDSTIWREPDHVRIVWITMLAKCDKNGMVYASIPGLSDASRVSLELCVEALKRLESPDEWSRSKDEDGRRILTVDGGWHLVNHQKYKVIKDADERKEYIRQKVKEYRTKYKGVNNVNKSKQCKHIRSDQIKSNKEDSSMFLESLKTNPAYSHIDIAMELNKMDAWLALPANRHRKKTSRFVLGWLNRIEVPLKTSDQQPQIYNNI